MTLKTVQRFEFIPTPLPGLSMVRRRPVRDARGYLERLFCIDEFAPILDGRIIVQANRTLTRARGTLRGMHLQRPPHAELKIVTCLRGSIFDVVIDLRRGSPTYGQWHAERLDGDNHAALAIPEGFAHGFQTLEDDCEMLYFHTAAHHGPSEAGVNPLDPALAIPWPHPVGEISARDRSHPSLAAFEP